MADIRTPDGPGDGTGSDDSRLLADLRALGHSESTRPDDLTRRRHLAAMRRARGARRPFTAVAAAAAVVALVAGAAIVGSGSGRPTDTELTRNATRPTDLIDTVALPDFDTDTDITPVPFRRTEDHVILKVDRNRAGSVREQLVASLGGAVPVVGNTADSTTFVVPASVARLLTDTTGVSAYPDSPVAAVGEQSPVPSWGLDRVDALDAPLDEKYAWTNAGAGSIIYVVDTGVYAAHSDLSGRVVSGYTAIDDGQGTDDCQGHGTHVAGTVAGGKYGVAKSATVVAVRVLDCDGRGYTSGVIAGINWVIENHPGGPGIINMSLGGPANSALDSAVSAATSAGIVVAVAAGNESGDACSYSPARAPSALTVGATDIDDARASYSNTGSCVDMWAPGSGITSAGISGPNASATFSGTSMASPHVAGLAARLLSMNPSLSVSDIRSRLVRKNSAETTPIVNLVEEPGDTPVTTTTTPGDTVPDTTDPVAPTTTVPEVTTTVPEATTTVPSPETTTVPPSTLPKRGRSGDAPGRIRRAAQPKRFELAWDTSTPTAVLVASWIVETVPDRYWMECEGGGRKGEETALEFEQSTVVLTPDGRSQTTLSVAPKPGMRCTLAALVGLEKSRESNTAVIPKSGRRPVTTTTTTTTPTTTTVPVTTTVPATTTTVPEVTTTVPEATTTVAPAGGRNAPVTTVRPGPATTVKPSPGKPTSTTVKGRKKDG